MSRRAVGASRPAKRERFVGVCLVSGRYTAIVTHEAQRYYLGMWPTAREAAVACDRAALALGIQRPLNLPKESRALGPATPTAIHRQARLRARELKNASRYLGVRWRGRDGRWLATVGVPGTLRSRPLGTFALERHAALAYDLAMRFLDPGVKLLNFPESTLLPMSVEDIRRDARRLLKEGKSSRFRGVWWATERQHWCAAISVGGVRKNLGEFAEERDAALAYDRAALASGGANVKLNFDPVTGVSLVGGKRVFR